MITNHPFHWYVLNIYYFRGYKKKQSKNLYSTKITSQLFATRKIWNSLFSYSIETERKTLNLNSEKIRAEASDQIFTTMHLVTDLRRIFRKISFRYYSHSQQMLRIFHILNDFWCKNEVMKKMTKIMRNFKDTFSFIIRPFHL